MKKGFTLIELLIVIALIGIFAALLIPNINTTMQIHKAKAKMTEMVALADSTTEYIESANIPKDEKELYNNYLHELILKAKNLPEPKSSSEAKERIIYLSQELGKFQQPERLFKEINTKETITSDPMFSIYLDIYKLSAKVDTLYSERLTKWDVAIVIFYILGGLGAFIAIITFVIKIPKLFLKTNQKASSRRQPIVIKKTKRIKKISS